MKTSLSKRLLSCLVSVALAVTFIPAAAFAKAKAADPKTDPQAAPQAVSAVAAATSANVYSEWPSFRGNDCNNGIVNFDTPAAANEATLLWSKSFGGGWSSAVSTQLIVDGYLIVMANTTIYKLDMNTGDVVAQGTLYDGFNWGYTPFAYGEGKIFVSLKTGKIQALDASTLESLWVYADPLKGQSVSPVVYSDGYVFTGFWNSETRDANYVCVKAADEDRSTGTEMKDAVWSITNTGGYYWAGGVAVGNYIVFGCDDGISDLGGTSMLRCVEKATGKVKGTLTLTGMGDQRSALCYAPELGKIFFTTTGGYLCSATVNAATGTLTNLQSQLVRNDVKVTSTPVYYKGRLYFGIGLAYDGGEHCRFVVADASTLKTIGSVQALGDVKASPLLSTATEENGYLCFYFTYNSLPGGISLAKVKNNCASSADIELIELYDAAEGPQYNITSVIASSNGTLYMKNDSGKVFAVGFSDAGRAAAAKRHASVFEKEVDALLPVTLNSGDAIAAAEARLAALPQAVHDAVSQKTLDKLAKARLAYDTLVADSQLAQTFAATVAGLFPVTLKSGSAISAARAQADKLTKQQKSLLPSNTLGDLKRAELEYAALAVDDAQVRKVMEDIAHLFPVSLHSAKAIEKAQAAYDALSDEQKAKVPEDVVASLADAQATYEQLVSDKAAAQEFADMVNALGKITKDSGGAITAAEEALADLTPDQLSFVPQSVLDKLTAARAAYDELMKPEPAPEPEPEPDPTPDPTPTPTPTPIPGPSSNPSPVIIPDDDDEDEGEEWYDGDEEWYDDDDEGWYLDDELDEDDENAEEEMVYTAKLDNTTASTTKKAAEQPEEEKGNPWIWAVVGGVALLVLAGAARLRLTITARKDDDLF